MPRFLTRILKWGGISLAALAATIAITGLVAGLWLARSVPAASGTLSLPGLGAPVEIVRDSHAIPHILSQNRRDAFFALGFAHAQDRLFQMELFRRFGRGRLAEIAGPWAVDADIYARTIGAARAAEADYAAASPELKAVLAAYADGVNAWLAVRDRPLPPEFTLLLTDPEPWQPSDSLVLGKLLGLMLTGNWFNEAQRARLAEQLDGETLEFLTPPVGGGPAPDGSGDLRNFTQVPVREAIERVLAFGTPAEGLIGPGASNAWAVAGPRTATGKPILANDPHLGLAAPGLWYLAHLSAPDLEVVGATLPGIPMPILGHNGHLAWGLTTTGGDASDLFIEKVDPADAARYLTPEGSQPFVTRQEEIKVRLGSPVTITVRETRHGPVVSDVSAGNLPRPAETVVALAHEALAPGDRTAEAMLGFLDAGDADQFLAAARNFHNPQQNLTYADDMGNIGMIAAGRIPIRKSGDGRMPADGSSGAADWTGTVPFEGLPQFRNPAAGFVFNANNAVTSPDAAWFIGKDFDVPYRAQRLHDLLAAKTGYTLDDAAAGQGDTFSPFFAEFLGILIDRHGEMKGGRTGEALDLLAKWDRHLAADRPEPLIAMAWARALNRRLFADDLGERYRGWAGLRPIQLRAVLNGQEQWCDDRNTPAAETCRDQIRGALADALDELADEYGDDLRAWRWGQAHVALMNHPILGFVPGLRGLVSITPPTAGGEDTLLRGAMRLGGDTPYANVHAAGFRAIYDLADLGRSRFSISTGQSGNPYSTHWDDLSAPWAAMGYIEIPTDRTAIQAAAVDHLSLQPRPR